MLGVWHSLFMSLGVGQNAEKSLRDFLPNNMAVAAQLPLKGSVFKISKKICVFC